MNQHLISELKNLPSQPGVYKFLNSAGKVIYVGKAKILKHRVASYFQNNLLLGSKTQALVSRITALETIKTESELEAIILEAELIKKFKPKYNIALKDDKSHLYIVFRNDLVELDNQKVLLPKIITARKTDLKKSDYYFGPYPHANTAKYIINVIRKVFPYRDCSLSKFNRYKTLKKPCLYGHMHMCRGPCAGYISVEQYKKEVNRIKTFLKGGSKKIVREFEKQMLLSSKSLEYEKAAQYRNILAKFDYVRANFKTAEKYIENPNLVHDTAASSLAELQSILPNLTKYPARIECYDISNISGKDSVGSMVVATNGLIDKSEYKRFKIKTKNSPDDFAMLYEVLERRLKRELSDDPKTKKWSLPDLIVLDGGKAQVSVVSTLLKALNCRVALIGLAKRYETIVYMEDEKLIELVVPKNNEGLKLLIKLRDEAHRFAQRYHHYLRSKQIRV